MESICQPPGLARDFIFKTNEIHQCCSQTPDHRILCYDGVLRIVRPPTGRSCVYIRVCIRACVCVFVCVVCLCKNLCSISVCVCVVWEWADKRHRGADMTSASQAPMNQTPQKRRCQAPQRHRKHGRCTGTRRHRGTDYEHAPQRHR